jgi:hypothetical protein
MFLQEYGEKRNGSMSTAFRAISVDRLTFSGNGSPESTAAVRQLTEVDK